MRTRPNRARLLFVVLGVVALIRPALRADDIPAQITLTSWTLPVVGLPAPNELKAVALDAAGNVWYATEALIGKLDPQTSRVKVWRSPVQNQSDLMVSSRGEIWTIGSTPSGDLNLGWAAQFDPVTETMKGWFVVGGHGLRITEAADGKIWALTGGGDISSAVVGWDPVTGVATDWFVGSADGLDVASGHVWITEHDGAVVRLTPGPQLSDGSATGLMATWNLDPSGNGDISYLRDGTLDADGNLMLVEVGSGDGTVPGGVIRFMPSSNQFHRWNFPDASSRPLGLSLGTDRSVWVNVGTESGFGGHLNTSLPPSQFVFLGVPNIREISGVGFTLPVGPFFGPAPFTTVVTRHETSVTTTHSGFFETFDVSDDSFRYPGHVVRGPDGVVWFTDPLHRRIWRLSNAELPSFNFGGAPLSQSIVQGQTASLSVTVDGIRGFAGDVSVRFAEIPGTMSGSILPARVTGDGTFAIGLTTSLATPPGSYAFTLVAEGGGLVRSLDFTVEITPADTSPPLLTPTLNPAPNGAGWNNSPVTLSWSASDPESGITTMTNCGTVVVAADTSGAGFTCSVFNGGGLTSSASVTIRLDTVSPTILGARSPAANAAGWNRTPVTVSFQCADEGSGVAACAATQVVNAEGRDRSVTGTVQDRAGNESSVTIDSINIDLTPPAVTAAVSRAPDMNGWYNHPFGVSWPGTDALSEIDTCSVPATYAGPDTAAGQMTGSCADRAGNTAPAPFAFTFDATAPSIVIAQPTDGATFALNQSAPAANYTCSDATSGVASCAGSLPSGTAIDTATPGERTVTVNGMDAAGNPASLTHRYTVRYAFEGFLAPLNNLPTSNRGPAGRTYPVKWILRDGNGAYIGDPASISGVTLVPGSCSGATAEVAGEDTAVQVSGLRFDPATGIWHFNWQTQKSQAGCWSLQLRLADGSVRAITFDLR